MSRVKGLSLVGLVLLTIVVCASFSNSRLRTTQANPAPQGDSGQPMQAILNEVHLLRLAIQRSNLNTYHAQVTLERFRLQQQQVNRLNEKMDSVRARLAKIKLDQDGISEEVKQAESNLAKEADPAKRRELEKVQQGLKLGMDHIAKLETQVREEETQLVGQLQVEQAKLTELNERLDALQKELEIVDKPQPGGKRQ